jgi:hypothetical protein
MGDTFPHSLETLDLRLRTAGKYSSFLQELGRMCRYPATRPILGSDNLPMRFKGAEVTEVEKRICLPHNAQGHKRVQSGPTVAFELPIVVRDVHGLFAGVACNPMQFHDLVSKVATPEFTIEVYLDRLPRAMVRKEIHECLIAAVNRKQERAPNNPEITAIECILMPQGLDDYITYKTKEATLLQNLPAVGMNPLHNYFDNCELSKRGGLNPSATQKPHYDYYEAGSSIIPVHPRRILLFAECQIGKTGAYLQLLSKLREEVHAGHHDIEIETPDRTRTWHLPYWRDLTTLIGDGKNKLDYKQPKIGYYHEKLAKQRLVELKAIATNPARRARWVEDYFKWVGGLDGELVVTKRSAPRTFQPYEPRAANKRQSSYSPSSTL